MKQKINSYITYLRTKLTVTSALLIFAVIATGTVFAMQGISGRSEQLASAATATEDVASALPAGVAIVGGEALLDATQPGNSWPGEIISYGSVPIQPRRSGTIVEWRVKIGQRVGTGQVLGYLSAPPVMPELVGMLADQAEGRARMRAQAAATKRFTEANNEQLRTLLHAVEATTNEDQTGPAKVALRQSRDGVTVMRKNIHTFLDQMLAKHLKALGGGNIIASFQYGNIGDGEGELNSQDLSAYKMKFLQLVRELNNADTFPTELATSYLASFVRLANTSIGGVNIDIRDMAREDQEKFLDMLAKYRDAEASVTMKEGEYALEYAGQKKDIEEKISENEKMLAMAEAEARAAETSYATVNQSITGGLAIVASRPGVISTITKKVGDFVEPGMPVATIDTERVAERFVRLQIPSNVRRLKAGEILSVVRPGFAQDVRKVKLTGVGTSLDTTGMYMADASFLTPVDWPVAASVRVLVPQNGTVPLIKLSSVWWDASGAPQVWGVSEAGRIFARKIKIGRTLGGSVEVYEGLQNGDRFVMAPTPDLREDMLLQSATTDDRTGQPSSSGEKKPMGGMEM